MWLEGRGEDCCPPNWTLFVSCRIVEAYFSFVSFCSLFSSSLFHGRSMVSVCISIYCADTLFYIRVRGVWSVRTEDPWKELWRETIPRTYFLGTSPWDTSEFRCFPFVTLANTFGQYSFQLSSFHTMDSEVLLAFLRKTLSNKLRRLFCL